MAWIAEWGKRIGGGVRRDGIWGAPNRFALVFGGSPTFSSFLLSAKRPLIAGLAAAPGRPFRMANRTSAVLWVVLVLTPGAFRVDALKGRSA